MPVTSKSRVRLSDAMSPFAESFQDLLLLGAYAGTEEVKLSIRTEGTHRA